MPEKIPVVIGTGRPCQPLAPVNRGNIFHAAATRRILGKSRDFPNPPWTPHQLDELKAHSHIVLVMANDVRLGRKDQFFWHEAAFENISKTDLPTVVFGLGAQGPLSGGADATVAPETLRLLKLLSDRSHKIGVRGSFTAEVLNKLGVNNVEVVGCQSCFWNLCAEFPFKLQVPDADSKGICFNYTNAATEADFIGWGIRSGFTLIGQGEIFEEHVQLGRTFQESPELRHMLETQNITKQAYVRYCRNNFMQFTNVFDWLHFVRKFKFSIGTRFHGNMIALQSGVAALWIVHDSRTKELCEYFCLPHISLDQALSHLSLSQFFDDANYEDFLSVYPDRFARFKQYIESAGLRHVLGAFAEPVPDIPNPKPSGPQFNPTASDARALPEQKWIEVAAFLRREDRTKDVVVAPEEFRYLCGRVVCEIMSDDASEMFNPETIVILHKGRLDYQSPEALEALLLTTPIFANAVFVLFSRTGRSIAHQDEVHIGPIKHAVAYCG